MSYVVLSYNVIFNSFAISYWMYFAVIGKKKKTKKKKRKTILGKQSQEDETM